MFGDSPLAIPHSFENTRFPAVEAKMRQLQKNREEALAAHELARTRMIEQRRSRFIPFQKGEKVWLDSRNLKTLYHKKMAPKREGPFEITDVLGPLTYRLQLPETWRIHNVFHASLLRRYRENDIYGENYERPPAELDHEGQEVYNVCSKTSKTRPRISILRQMGGVSDHRSIVGTGRIIFERRRHSQSIQDTSSSVKHGLTDPRHRFSVIAFCKPRRTGLALSGFVRPIQKPVQLFQRYKLSSSQLPSGIHCLRNSTFDLFPLTTLKYYASCPNFRQSFVLSLSHRLLFRVLRPSCSFQQTNLARQIPSSRKPCRHCPFSSLPHYLCHHLHSRKSHFWLTDQSRPCIWWVRYTRCRSTTSTLLLRLSRFRKETGSVVRFVVYFTLDSVQALVQNFRGWERSCSRLFGTKFS